MWEKVREDGDGDTGQERPFLSAEPEKASRPQASSGEMRGKGGGMRGKGGSGALASLPGCPFEAEVDLPVRLPSARAAYVVGGRVRDLQQHRHPLLPPKLWEAGVPPSTAAFILPAVVV